MADGYPQPLAAFYAQSCLATVRALLDATPTPGQGGQRSLRAALDRSIVCYVGESDLLATDPEQRSSSTFDMLQDLARRGGSVRRVRQRVGRIHSPDLTPRSPASECIYTETALNTLRSSHEQDHRHFRRHRPGGSAAFRVAPT